MNFQEWTRQTQRALTEAGGGRYYTIAEVDGVLRHAVEILKEELRAGGDLTLIDVGRLYAEDRPEQWVKSNLPGAEHAYHVPAHRVVKFKASKALIRWLNE